MKKEYSKPKMTRVEMSLEEHVVASGIVTRCYVDMFNDRAPSTPGCIAGPWIDDFN